MKPLITKKKKKKQKKTATKDTAYGSSQRELKENAH